MSDELGPCDDIRFWRFFRRDVCFIPVYVSWRYVQRKTYTETLFKKWKIMYLFGFRVAAWRVNA